MRSGRQSRSGKVSIADKEKSEKARKKRKKSHTIINWMRRVAAEREGEDATEDQSGPDRMRSQIGADDYGGNSQHRAYGEQNAGKRLGGRVESVSLLLLLLSVGFALFSRGRRRRRLSRYATVIILRSWRRIEGAQTVVDEPWKNRSYAKADYDLPRHHIPFLHP